MGATPGEAQVRVELELELGTDPIRGALSDPGGRRAPFSGWLELMGELERIRDPHVLRGSPAAEDEGGMT